MGFSSGDVSMVPFTWGPSVRATITFTSDHTRKIVDFNDAHNDEDIDVDRKFKFQCYLDQTMVNYFLTPNYMVNQRQL